MKFKGKHSQNKVKDLHKLRKLMQILSQSVEKLRQL